MQTTAKIKKNKTRCPVPDFPLLSFCCFFYFYFGYLCFYNTIYRSWFAAKKKPNQLENDYDLFFFSLCNVARFYCQKIHL